MCCHSTPIDSGGRSKLRGANGLSSRSRRWIASLLIVFEPPGMRGARSVQARWNSAISRPRFSIRSTVSTRGSDVAARHVVVEHRPHRAVVPGEDRRAARRSRTVHTSASMPAKRVPSSSVAQRCSRSWSSTNRKYEPYDDTLQTSVDAVVEVHAVHPVGRHVGADLVDADDPARVAVRRPTPRRRPRRWRGRTGHAPERRPGAPRAPAEASADVAGAHADRRDQPEAGLVALVLALATPEPVLVVGAGELAAGAVDRADSHRPPWPSPRGARAPAAARPAVGRTDGSGPCRQPSSIHDRR